MILKMTIEVKLENGMDLKEDEERIWAENEVLVGDGTLILHSNEIGDEVGVVKKVTNVRWENES
jgi:hypothetical protein